MFDRIGIYQRFASCYGAQTPSELARILGVTQQSASQWFLGQRQVPWKRLKEAVDTQGLSWEWMLEGEDPKQSTRGKRKKGKDFDRHAINQRFLSLFPGLSNAKLGKRFGVSSTTVFRWHNDVCQVPWDKLKYTVDNLDVTWEWLLEGC